MQRDGDPGGVAADALVGAVVDDLVGEVVDAAAVGGPDVHAWAFPDSVQPFQVREVVSPVQGLWLCGHEMALPVAVGGQNGASLPGASDTSASGEPGHTLWTRKFGKKVTKIG
ncbi:hypothetical protein Areg01_55450 [Actinoplanes regularis]|nr:hypothetical protein Areg01_55450 [Actinoplanes regularis]